MARLLSANGEEHRVEPRNKRAGFTLDELYKLLSCTTVECVPLGEGASLLVDEDGKAKPTLARNDAATKLLHAAGGMPLDFVVGDALVVSSRELR